MSYMGRAWMAATLAMAQGRVLGGGSSGAASTPSDPPSSCVRQAAGRLPTARGAGDERRGQAEDAVRSAMFVSCWMSSSNRAPQRDGKAPTSPVPPSPPAPQAPPSPSTYSPDYWKDFYMGWKMALHKASRLYDHKGLTNIVPDIGPRAEHICSSPSSPPSTARSSSSPPSSTE
ncbi:hypothetical protein Taro_043243 [Colocasia esculenta]|uniref:Uncharacterized protein n=1 Tax=Colocasia esculenta TaxID=4460 RepID=A0A843X3T7_COLES|nr:hypothetical protein [Colocasia esculenta]